MSYSKRNMYYSLAKRFQIFFLTVGILCALANILSPQAIRAELTASSSREELNRECEARGGVLGPGNDCTTCTSDAKCITRDMVSGEVLPLYYPAACRAAGGTYSGTVSGGTTEEKCTKNNQSLAIKLAPGAIASVNSPNNSGLKTDCKAADINAKNCKIIDWLLKFINGLSAIVGIIIVISIIIGGIQYSAAGGNPQNTEAAKKRIASAILALLLYIFTFAFLQWIVPGGIF